MTAPPVQAIDASELRAAFRSAASSAWVVTGRSPDGAPVGFTAISIISVSVDPPLVTFNISKTSSSLAAISRSRRAALHLLSDQQAAIAQRFAGDRGQRFVEDGLWSFGWDGLPRVHDVVTRLTTEVVDLVEAGDSYIAVAAVGAVDATDRQPLVHHDGVYRHFSATSPKGA